MNRLVRRILKKGAAPQLAERDFFDVTYASPSVPQRESLARKLAFGVMCSALVTAMMNLLSIKKGIVYGCALMLWVCGWRAEPPKGSEEAKQGGFFARNVKKAKAALHVGLDKAKAAQHKAAAPVRRGVGETKKKLKDIEKNVEKGKDEVVSVFKAGQVPGRGVVPPNANGDFPRPDLPPDPRLALANRAEGIQRDRLTARAMAINLAVNPEWGVAVFEAQVNKAEDEAWKQHYNGQCTHCRNALSIPPARQATSLRCNHCRHSMAAKDAMRLGSPTRPNTGKPVRLL